MGCGWGGVGLRAMRRKCKMHMCNAVCATVHEGFPHLNLGSYEGFPHPNLGLIGRLYNVLNSIAVCACLSYL